MVRHAAGTTIVVENKPGAGGMRGADIVAKGAPAISHLVMMSSAASHGHRPVLYKRAVRSVADFTHIHLVGTFPSVLAREPARRRSPA